jgi:hypothetical protein
VALEAGNSPAIIFKNYRELATEEQACKWFGILPKASQWQNTFEIERKKRTTKKPRWSPAGYCGFVTPCRAILQATFPEIGIQTPCMVVHERVGHLVIPCAGAVGSYG